MYLRWIRWSQCLNIRGELCPSLSRVNTACRARVEIGGAKNAALPILAAALLTADECFLENLPDIEDIRNMLVVA